jgi:hypothetical protein
MTAVDVDVAPPPLRPRSRLGIAAFVLVLVAIAAPVVFGIVGAVTGLSDGGFGGDASAGGWAALGGLVLFGIGVAVVSPLAIAGTVLAIVSLFRRDRRRGFGIAALVLGVVPSVVGALLIPVAAGFLH